MLSQNHVMYRPVARRTQRPTPALVSTSSPHTGLHLLPPVAVVAGAVITALLVEQCYYPSDRTLLLRLSVVARAGAAVIENLFISSPRASLWLNRGHRTTSYQQADPAPDRRGNNQTSSILPRFGWGLRVSAASHWAVNISTCIACCKDLHNNTLFFSEPNNGGRGRKKLFCCRLTSFN